MAVFMDSRTAGRLGYSLKRSLSSAAESRAAKGPWKAPAPRVPGLRTPVDGIGVGAGSIAGLGSSGGWLILCCFEQATEQL